MNYLVLVIIFIQRLDIENKCCLSIFSKSWKRMLKQFKAEMAINSKVPNCWETTESFPINPFLTCGYNYHLGYSQSFTFQPIINDNFLWSGGEIIPMWTKTNIWLYRNLYFHTKVKLWVLNTAYMSQMLHRKLTFHMCIGFLLF